LEFRLTGEKVASCNYTLPIVDHNLQQRRFKELFKQQKQGQLSLELE
jgi:hypothetical protein